jgi:hypothetical protein
MNWLSCGVTKYFKSLDHQHDMCPTMSDEKYSISQPHHLHGQLYSDICKMFFFFSDLILRQSTDTRTKFLTPAHTIP